MARIPMRSGFTLIPEGKYVFKITEVKYDERFGKLEIALKTQKGQTHTERYGLLDANGNLNEKALNAFSYFAKTALQNFDLTDGDDIDPMELVGRFIEADVEHDVQSKKDKTTGQIIEGQTVTFVRLGTKTPASGWAEEAPAAPAQSAPAKRSWL